MRYVVFFLKKRRGFNPPSFFTYAYVGIAPGILQLRGQALWQEKCPFISLNFLFDKLGYMFFSTEHYVQICYKPRLYYVE